MRWAARKVRYPVTSLGGRRAILLFRPAKHDCTCPESRLRKVAPAPLSVSALAEIMRFLSEKTFNLPVLGTLHRVSRGSGGDASPYLPLASHLADTHERKYWKDYAAAYERYRPPARDLDLGMSFPQTTNGMPA